MTCRVSYRKRSVHGKNSRLRPISRRLAEEQIGEWQLERLREKACRDGRSVYRDSTVVETYEIVATKKR